MPERDRVIKSGQLTLPRILFLAAIGAFVVGTVALGGIYLTIGYWALTLAICGLLYLIAIDYGVHMEKVDVSGHASTQASQAIQGTASSDAKVTSEPRQRKRSNRPAKRRR